MKNDNNPYGAEESRAILVVKLIVNVILIIITLLIYLCTETDI